jgi:hypothetical protein
VPIQEVRFYGRRRAPAFFAPFFLYYSTIRFRR